MQKEWTFTLEAAELAEAYQFMASLLPRNKRRRLALLLCVDFVYRFLFSLEWTAGRLVGCDRTLRLVDRQGQWLAVDDLSA